MMAPGYPPQPGMPMMPQAVSWPVRPFSQEEHASFLDAMEKYGQESTGSEWDMIAQAVGNGRTTHEVRVHAHEYFLNLQAVTMVEPDARVLGSKIKREDWTYEQDMVFEHAMAEFEETDPLRWLKVASLLPGKNHEDVRHRYQRLLYDVHKIEHGVPMEMKYKPPRAGKSLLAKVAAKSGSASAGRPRGMSSKGTSSGSGLGGGMSIRDGVLSKGTRPKPHGKGKATLMKLEALEREVSVKPSKPAKNKIKGKGGGYILRSSSPRGSRATSAKAQRKASVTDTKGSTPSGGRGQSSPTGPRPGSSRSTRGGGGTGTGASSTTAAFKRSAVAHLATLKRVKVADDSLKRPSNERGGEQRRGSGHVDEDEPEREVETPRRKSARGRKRRTDQGQAPGDGANFSDEEPASATHSSFRSRR